MNPKEYESFILNLYNAGPNNQEAINQMHQFVATPGSLYIILSAISSHQISRLTTLISLSCIPNTKIQSPEEMEFLREWFKYICFNDAESLLSDDFIALLSNIFLFSYESDQMDGSSLIQDLADAGPAQLNLSIQIILRILEKTDDIDNTGYLIPIALIPFLDKNSSPQLVSSAALLLIHIFTHKSKHDRENSFILITKGIEIGFPQQLFSFLFRSNEPLTIHLLQLLEIMVSFPAFSYPSQAIRKNFLLVTTSTFLDFLKKCQVTPNLVPVLSSLFVQLRKIAPLLFQIDPVDTNKKQNSNNGIGNIKNANNENKKIPKKKTDPMIIISKLIEEASNFTLFLFQNDDFFNQLELILEFWSNKENIGSFVNQKYHTEEIRKIGQEIINRFFSFNSAAYEIQIQEILEDKSSMFIKTLINVFHFDLPSFCQEVCKFLIEYRSSANSSPIISAFSIEFLSQAALDDSMMNYFEPVFETVFNSIRPIEDVDESTLNCTFEISLIHFFNTLINRFLIQYSKALCSLFYRFLLDIKIFQRKQNAMQQQSNDDTMSFLIEISEILQSKLFSDQCLNIAKDPRIFEIIISSDDILVSAGKMPKKIITTFFQTLFQIGFTMPDPNQFFSLLELIARRFEQNTDDINVYYMLTGGFLAENVNFDFLFANLLQELFPNITEVMKKDINKVIPILHLLAHISKCSLRIKTSQEINQYLSKTIINFCDFTFDILNIALNSIDLFPNNLETNNIDTENQSNNPKQEYTLRVSSIIMGILSDLLSNKNINFGVLEFYNKKISFSSMASRISTHLLLISFDELLQYPKLMARYSNYIHSLICEYPNIFITMDEILLMHQLQILNFLLCTGPKETALNSANSLIYLTIGIKQSEVKLLEEKCGSSIPTIICTALNLFLKNGIREDPLIQLIFAFLYTFPKARQIVFDQIFEKARNSLQLNEIHTIISRITDSFYQEEDISIKIVKSVLMNLISYAKCHDIDLCL